MLWVPQCGFTRHEHNTGAVGADPFGTSISTGAASSTKGTAVELIASTSFDAWWVTIIASNYGVTTAASDGSMDILIGAATESVLIADLLMGYCGGETASAGLGPKRWDFPLYIPAGSRLAAQAAGLRTLTAMRVGIFLYGGNGSPSHRVGSRVTTYGIGTVPNGTAITPGASGGEGAWAQITASTTEDHFALVPSFQPTNDSTINFRSYALDLGVGAATEEEVAQSYWYMSTNTERFQNVNSMPAFVDVPSGTRLAMRASNSGTNDAGYDGAIHAVS